MAVSRTYLVPVDFSKSSEIALNQAIEMARENRGKLLLVHVISATFAYPLEGGFSDIFEALEKNARESMKKLFQRKRLKPARDRSILITGLDPAQAIVRQAKKSRASMIIMGSHGRTGLQKFLLGSVAERTLRYAHCPVLIVKK
ncbi:MAG: universal stress protein [Deltaproteobacteria bacterium]|nr:universal stress protein [Deltaproteobacteria bacterium]MDZ4343485.1 universal stress protein [Candidatus Binatia bacterium]